MTREKNLKQFNNLTKNDVLAFIDDIWSDFNHQEIHFLWRAFLQNSNDDMVLEVAVNANADAIITFNPKILKELKRF